MTMLNDFYGIEDLRLSPVADWEGRREVHFIVLGPDDQTYLYSWGHNNVIPWEDVVDKLHVAVEAGGFQTDITDIAFDGGRILIRELPSEYKWGRNRTKYSLDVKNIVRELLRRALITPRTRIKLGNWANKKGYVIGTAAEIAGRRDVPQRIVLYHGTTDYHYNEYITTIGLCPVPLEKRIWKDAGGKRGHPEHRDLAVYLTASPSQAEYYANKAVRTLRARGYRGLQPVMLKVLLLPSDYPNLRADDDYLQMQRYDKKPAREDDWFDSLQNFAQVAFIGCVPPERVAVIEKSPLGGYEE